MVYSDHKYNPEEVFCVWVMAVHQLFLRSFKQNWHIRVTLYLETTTGDPSRTRTQEIFTNPLSNVHRKSSGGGENTHTYTYWPLLYGSRQLLCNAEPWRQRKVIKTWTRSKLGKELQVWTCRVLAGGSIPATCLKNVLETDGRIDGSRCPTDLPSIVFSKDSAWVDFSLKTYSDENGVFNSFFCHFSVDGGHR